MVTIIHFMGGGIDLLTTDTKFEDVVAEAEHLGCALTDEEHAQFRAAQETASAIVERIVAARAPLARKTSLAAELAKLEPDAEACKVLVEEAIARAEEAATASAKEANTKG